VCEGRGQFGDPAGFLHGNDNIIIAMDGPATVSIELAFCEPTSDNKTETGQTLLLSR
jgi:hypothetical protein